MAVRSVVFDVLASTGSFERGMGAASAAATKAATTTEAAIRRIETAGAKTQAVGAKLSKSITLPILALGGVAVDLAARYQKANALLQTAGGETAAKMKVISAGVMKVAQQTGASLSDLQEGMYTVAKAGATKWSAVDQLKVLKAAAQGAAAENVPLSTSVSALTSVMQGYGTSAKKAVSVENQLVRGSGLAKVSMQDFAGSLANVVPLASALHVKFSQVAGAIDVMTQHGETADRATQNIANLLTNLAGQSSVSTSAMQQLGINTVDLQKNLGTRGLTGTLAIVDKALKDHTKNGMVVTSVYKDAKLANQSLNDELGTFTGALGKQSKGLLDGQVGIKDYTNYAKSLGGQAGASALQFLALYRSSQGFSDQLKTGQGTVRTSATELQKMLGGVTGMRTALMLTGTSAKTFTTDTSAVAKAAQAAGANILNWGLTQATFNQKMKTAKANLQVLAVEVGTALLPAITGIVKVASGLVGWFSHLSSGTQGWIIKIALLGAALGPVLSIIGRFAKLGALLLKGGVAVKGFAATTVESFSRSGVAAQAQAVADQESAAKVALAEAEKARAAATSADQIAAALRGTDSMLAEDAASAARSAELFARAMEARANAAVLSSAKATVAFETADRAALTSAAGSGAGRLAAGAVGVAGVAGVAEGAAAKTGLLGRLGTSLRGTGGLVAGLGLGIGGNILGNAISGNSKAGTGRNIAGTAVSDAGTGAAIGSMFGPEGLAIGGALGAGYGALKSWITGVDKLSAGEKDLNTVFKNGTTVVGSYAQNIVAGGKALKAHQTATAAAALAQTDLAKQAASAGLTTTDLTNAITGNAVAYNRVIAAWKAGSNPSQASLNALMELRKEFTDGTPAAQKYADAHGLVLKSEQKTANQTAVLSGRLGNLNTLHLSAATNATLFHEQLDDLTKSVQQNGTSLNGNSLFGQRNIAMVREAASQALAHAQAVYQQTGSLKKADSALSSDRAQLIKQATQAGLSKTAVQKLANQIDNIPPNKHSKITVDTAAAQRSLSRFSSWYDSVIANLSQPHITVPKGASSDPRNKGLGGLVAAGGKASGGGLPEGVSSVGERGAELAIKRGPRVDILSNPQAKHFLAATGMRAPGFASGTKPTYNVGGTTYTSKVGADNAERRLLLNISKAIGSFETVADNTSKSAADLRAAVAALKTSAKSAKASAADLASITRAGAAINSLAKKRDSLSARLGSKPSSSSTAYDKLTQAQSDYADAKSSVASAFTGSFDITTAGVNAQVYNDVAAAPVSASSILSQLTTAASNASAFGRLLKTLAKEGLNKTLLMQLAQAGPGALTQAQALAAATPKQLLGINSQYAGLTGSGNTAGSLLAGDMYGAGVKSAQSLVNGLVSQEKQLDSAIDRLAKRMAKRVGDDFGIHEGGSSHAKSHHSSGSEHGKTVVNHNTFNVTANNVDESVLVKKMTRQLEMLARQ